MKKQTNTYYSLRSFTAYAKHHRGAVSITFFAFLVSNLMLSGVPLLIGGLVQAATTPNSNDTIMLYVWLLVIASSGHDITWRVSEILHRRFINPLSFAYETMLFHHIIAKPYPYFVDKFSGKISSYITTISAEFRGIFADFFYAYTGQLVAVVSMAIILATINWQTFALFTLGIAGMLIVGRHTLKQSSKYEAISADVQSTKNGHIIDSIANFASIKSFQKELSELKTLKKSQSAALKASQDSYWRGIIFWASMSFFVRHLIWPLTILLNVQLFFAGQLSLGQLATVLSTILLFSSVVWDVIWQLSQLNLRFARAEEAHRYLFGDVVFDEAETAALSESKLIPFRQSLSLKDLTFAYPDKPDTAVLQNINLTIKKGEKIGIVGRSGSGKTTLVKLLLDYYQLGNSVLQIDDAPISPKELTSSIAYVPQDTSLFHRSIADNIAYASHKEASRDAVIMAAKKAHADEFIQNTDGRYDALVGERGVKLSGGQRQRIAIARAILKDSPILILDEATSALDSESELLIQEALWELMEDRTAIVIAHRLSTIQKMDRIVVLDKGKIVEVGTHNALLEKQGVYAKLWAHQSGGFIEE
jgi:ATP-binding cassette subfamily B protein